MELALDSRRLRIHVDERVGFSDVAAAPDDPKPRGLGAGCPDHVKVLEARFDRHRFALRVFGARCREPSATVMKLAFRSAGFAGAVRSGDRESDCFPTPALCTVVPASPPVEPS